MALGTTLHWANARVEVTLPAALARPLSGLNAHLGVAEGRSALPLPGLALALWAPLYDSMRVWGRYAIPLMVALTGPVGLGGAWLSQRRPWGRVALALLGALVVAEGWVAPYVNPYDLSERELTAASVNARPQVNALLEALPPGTPIVEYPRGWADKLAMYAQTFHHQPVVNGYMSRQPDVIAQADAVLGRWATAGALPLLRHWGVRYLVFSYYPREDFDQALGALLQIPELTLEAHFPDGFGVFTETYIFAIREDASRAVALLPVLRMRGFHGQEVDGAGRFFRWTAPEATIILPRPANAQNLRLELDLAGGRAPDAPACEIAILVEGEPVYSGVLPNAFAPTTLTLDVPVVNAGAPELEIVLRASAWLPGGPGDRALGAVFYGARARAGP